MTSVEAEDQAGRGRRRRPRREVSTAIRQPQLGRVVSSLPTFELVGAEGVERIHAASLKVLAEVGIDFLHEDARTVLKAAGATLGPEPERVRFDPALVDHLVAQAPAQFPLLSHVPERSVGFGGREMVFAAVASAPNVSGLGAPRRRGNFQDFEDLVRLGHMLNAVHIFGGYPVEPVDIDPRTRHLDCLRSFITLSDKPFHAYSLGRQRITDALEMVRLAHGLTAEELAAAPRLFTIINTSSPLRLDGPMIEGLMEMARHGQIVVVTPFTLAGAMAPATIPGALVLQNAEALAGICLVQATKPGAPVMYGGFTSNVDMKSGAPAFGTPEYAQATIVGGQLARRYNIPFRSSNANACNTVDAQAAYESSNSVWAASLAGCHLMMHAAGWMEGGLTASFEKMVVDAEILSSMAAFLKPLTVDDETLALDAITEVGPGGHFFGAAHTLARYETAFYAPILSDWRNFGAWTDAGAPDATQRAASIARSLVDAHQPPDLDAGRLEALDAFIAKRREEGGAPPL
ncbi:MAG: trimethylamine methyltransferase family protein [Rhodospirillaceae bacterium]|nr:trimethylamine methyltransferase family protein [Rhodospirillaceae bacterium]